jgi:hypothetical protein
MTQDWIKDFYTKGYAHFYEPELASMINVDDVDFVYHQERLRDNFRDGFSKQVVQQMDLATAYLTEKYIDKISNDYEFMNYVIWEGTDADSSLWHNDGFEGGNVFFLMYFDDQKEESGGEVQFKWPGGGPDTYYPRKGDVMILNQTSGFFHRASKSGITRRNSSFTFNVKDLQTAPISV